MPKPRSIPSSVAPVLEELELERPAVVTKDLLRELIARADVQLSPEDVAERLQRHGWLLSLRTRGAWEFAPGSRAGPIGAGDPLVELRATRLRRPDLPVAVAYESAAWLNKLSQRPPARHVIAVPSGESVPRALADLRITRNWAHLDPIVIDDLPVWRIESLIALIGKSPLAFRDWPNIREWLPEAIARTGPGLLVEELEGRLTAAWARTGYLVATANGEDLAQRIRSAMPRAHGPFYLGRRDAPGRYDKTWEVVDSLLHRSMAERKRERGSSIPAEPRRSAKPEPPGDARE